MKRVSLTSWILIALVAGVVFGAVTSRPARELGILGTIFLRLIKSIIAPLLFGTLVSGIAGTGNVKTMGRIGGKAILYFEIVTTSCIVRRPGGGESGETGHRRAIAKGCRPGCRCNQRQPFTDSGTYLSHQHYRFHGEGRGTANRCLRLYIRRGLRDGWVESSSGGGVMRVARGGHVRVHRIM